MGVGIHNSWQKLFWLMTIFMAAWIFRSNLNYIIHKNTPSTFILAPNRRLKGTDCTQLTFNVNVFIVVVSVTNVPSVICIKLICCTCNSYKSNNNPSEVGYKFIPSFQLIIDRVYLRLVHALKSLPSERYYLS